MKHTTSVILRTTRKELTYWLMIRKMDKKSLRRTEEKCKEVLARFQALRAKRNE